MCASCTERMKMKRYKYLDVARGIGLMLVVISHSCGLNSYLINFYIPLFFVLSGYTYKQGRSYKENIAKKAKRLLIPYFAYSGVLFLFYLLMGRTREEMLHSAFGIFYSRFCLYDTTLAEDNVYLFTIANGAMWYLTAFFAASLVFHLVVDRALRDKKFLIGCTVVLLAVTMALAELPVLLPWSADLIGAAVLFMLAGTLLGRAEFFEKKWNPVSVLAVFASYMLLSTVNPGINMSLREYGRYGAFSAPVFVIIGVAGSMLCIWAAKLIQDIFVGRLLNYIGQNTIIILAFHILGLEIFETIAKKFIDVASFTGAAFAAYHTVRVAAVTIGCLILGKILDVVKAMWKARVDKA